MLEKDQRIFEQRAKKFAKVRSKIVCSKKSDHSKSESNFELGSRNRLTSPTVASSMHSQRTFTHIQDPNKRQNATIQQNIEQTNRLFKDCTKYLNQRESKNDGAKKTFKKHETFLFKVKQMHRGDKAPPIVLRSLDGYQEEQPDQMQMYQDQFSVQHSAVNMFSNAGSKDTYRSTSKLLPQSKSHGLLALTKRNKAF